jgi:hypothetical protein
MKADLHIHTTYSDSTLTPSEVVREARMKRIGIVAITDHDTVLGIDEAIEEGEVVGVEVIPGVELSAYVRDVELHILGFFIDHKRENLLKYLERFKLERVRRARRIIEKLNKIGIDIRLDDLKGPLECGCVGRLHVAQVLIQKNMASSIKEAFEGFLSKGKPGYVEKFKLHPFSAIKLINGAGGIPVLAHPYYPGNIDILPDLVKEGLKGIEVFHPEHGVEDVERFQLAARRYGLLVTGGSDSHGARKEGGQIGSVLVDQAIVDSIKDEAWDLFQVQRRENGRVKDGMNGK